MIRHKCPICKRVWYCEGNDICEQEKFMAGNSLGGCMCSECTLNVSVPEEKCKVIKYEVEWRIA